MRHGVDSGVDHRSSNSRKGQSAYDRRDNLVLACKRCNTAKADKPFLVFLLAQRSRAERLLRLELLRQAGDREIGRLRLIAAVAVVSWLATLFVAARLIGAGGPLWVAYLCWILGVFLLYWPCRWFAGVKARRQEWWLSYL